jgi:hypothetical protein
VGSRAQGYYSNAAACEHSAAKSTDPEVQDAYRAMIRCWLELARRAEWLDAREAGAVSSAAVAAATAP